MARIQKKKSTAVKKTQKKKQPDSGELSDKKQTKGGGSVAESVKTTVMASAKKKPEKRSTSKVDPDKRNIIQKSIEFIKEVQIELKKVTWPTRKQTAGTTLVVIILVFIIAAFLGLFDYGLSKLVQVVLA